MESTRTGVRAGGDRDLVAVIADPEAGMRRVLRCILQSRGFRCRETSGAGDVLGPAANAAVVVLSVDVEHGELAEITLWDVPARPKILVIGWPEDLPRIVRTLDLGADEYLVKPFTFRALNGRLDLFLSRRNRAGPGGTEPPVLRPGCQLPELRSR